MKSARGIYSIIAALVVAALQGCFTGIESTPRITERDVKRYEQPATQQSAIAAALPAPGLSGWANGRRFEVTSQRLSLLLEREARVEPGEMLLYRGYTPTLTFTGDTATVLLFERDGSDGAMLRYPLDVSPGRLLASESLNIPFTVDLDMAAAADSLLRGRNCYILTSLRVDSIGNGIAHGRRYVAVTIDRVRPGNDIYPLIVDFTDDRGVSGSVVMTAGSDRMATRNFDSLFTFDDPRQRYATIPENNWEAITCGEIFAGMTPEQCRLSIGQPDDITKGHNGGMYYERWTFENGSYLNFEDGVLTTFRR